MTRIVPLSHVVAEFESGSRPAGGVSDATGEVLSFGGEHLNDLGGFNLSAPKRVSREYFAGMKRGRVSERDILIVKDGATTGKVSYVPDGFAHLPCAINEHIFRLSVKPGVADAKWVFYYLYSSYGNSEILKDFRGSTIGGITQDVANKATIPLPPLPEQQRIAGILSRADRLRRLRRHALEMSDGYLQAVFLEMFGDPVANTKKWQTKELRQIAAINRGRFSPRPRSDPKFYGGDHPFIQTGDIARSNGFLRHYSQTLNSHGIKVSRAFDVGTIVIAIVGATIGETAILGIKTYCPDSVIGIKVHPEDATPEYVEYQLRFWKPVFRMQAPETARANINLETLKPLTAALPPLSMQQAFSEIVYRHERVRSQQREALRQAEHLFQTLLNGAFRGEG